jgi:hypothetical protein
VPDAQGAGRSGVPPFVPVTLSPVEIQALRSLFTTYRLYKKQETPLKNRIHSLLKEPLYDFTQEAIFDCKSRETIRGISNNPVLSFQLNQLGKLQKNS